jgi:hypothetical protein
MNDIILEVCNLEKSPFGNATDENLLSSMVLISGKSYNSRKRISGEKNKNFVPNSMNSILPEEANEQIAANQAKQKHEINLHSGFVNLKHSIKIIE